jgi:hypothetical protein
MLFYKLNQDMNNLLLKKSASVSLLAVSDAPIQMRMGMMM